MITFLLIVIILLLVCIINPIWIEVVFVFGLILAILAFFAFLIYFGCCYDGPSLKLPEWIGWIFWPVSGIWITYDIVKHFKNKKSITPQKRD